MKGKKVDPMVAATRVFDINYDQASYLFAADTHLSEAEGELEMVDRIREFVKHKGNLEEL